VKFLSLLSLHPMKKATKEQKEMIEKERPCVQVDKLSYEKAVKWIEYLELKEAK